MRALFGEGCHPGAGAPLGTAFPSRQQRRNTPGRSHSSCGTTTAPVA